MVLAFTDPTVATGHLGVAIADVSDLFNVEVRRHGAPDRLTLQEGTCERGQRTVCTYAVSRTVGVLTSTQRDGANIKDFAVMFVGKDRADFQDAISTYALAMAVFDPELTEDERGDIVKRLFEGIAGKEEFAIEGKAVRYKLLKTKTIGLHFVIEPKA